MARDPHREASDWTGTRIPVTVDGRVHHLFVRDTGPRGESAVLFLHGFPTSSLDWCRIAARFADRRAIFCDLLGFGYSDKPRLRYSYGLQADLVEALLQDLGVSRVQIVAHDYSTTLAQELLRREQASARATWILQVAFLNGGVYHHLHRKVLFHRLLLTPVVGGLVARRVRPKALAKGFNAIAGRPDAWTLADAEIHWQAMACHGGLARLPDLVHYIADRATHGSVWENAMETAAGKIGFIWGPSDPVSGAHVLNEIRSRMPSVPSFALPRTGHYPQWESPEETAEALSTFFTKVS